MLQSVFTNARERLEQDGNLPSPVQSEQEEDDQEDDDDDQDSPKKRGRGPDKKVGLIFFPSKTNVPRLLWQFFVLLVLCESLTESKSRRKQ